MNQQVKQIREACAIQIAWLAITDFTGREKEAEERVCVLMSLVELTDLLPELPDPSLELLRKFRDFVNSNEDIIGNFTFSCTGMQEFIDDIKTQITQSGTKSNVVNYEEYAPDRFHY